MGQAGQVWGYGCVERVETEKEESMEQVTVWSLWRPEL